MSATEEDGEEDISHGGRWRGRHQPRRKMERKGAAASRRSEDCPSRPAPFTTVGKKQNVHFVSVFSPLSMHVYANSVTVFSCIMTDKSIVTTLHVLNSSYDVSLILTPHPPFPHPMASPVSCGSEMSSTAVLKKTTFLYRFLCTRPSRKTLRIMTLELGTVDTETMAPSRSSGSSFRRFFLSS